jgi:hypothetical protein
MTFEKWVVGILAVAFGASILWVFTRSRSADPVPATPAGIPVSLQEPPAPEPAAERVPAPEAMNIRHHAAPERRSVSGGSSAQRVVRSSRTISTHGHRSSRRHRHAKHATRTPRPAAPKAKPKA